MLAGPWLNEEDRREAESFIALHGLSGHVVFTGPVSTLEHKRSIYSSADLFVFPGLQQEGQPLVVIEAMAAGLSVVVSSSASANLHDKNFIKILPDNILTDSSIENQQAVCQVIKETIANNQLLRPEITEYAKENFDFSYIIKNYVNNVGDFIRFQGAK